LLQYKYVVRNGWADDAPAQWSGGPNHMVATGGEAKGLLRTSSRPTLNLVLSPWAGTLY
jgi:hypothetical protein